MHGQYVSGYLVQHHLTNLVGTFATGKLVKAVVRKQILHSGVKVYGTSCKIENQISSAPEIVYKVERRTLYRCGGERAMVPMEWRAGIVAGHWTGLAARQASVLVAHVTPQEGEAVFGEWGRMRPSKSSLDRLAKELGARWEGQREAFEAALREGGAVAEEAVTVAVSLDGVMVRMRSGRMGAQAIRRRGVGRSRPVMPKRLETVYVGRMPQPCKEALKKTLCAELEAVLAKRPDLQVVKIADGAHDNWRYLDTLAPQGTSVVDFYHAAEQLKSGLDACYGQDDAKGRAHYEKLRHLLRHDCEKVIRSLNHQRRKQPESKRIAEVLGYFRNHRHRMRYASVKARHLPIGSGVGGDVPFGDAILTPTKYRSTSS